MPHEVLPRFVDSGPRPGNMQLLSFPVQKGFHSVAPRHVLFFLWMKVCPSIIMSIFVVVIVVLCKLVLLLLLLC